MNPLTNLADNSPSKLSVDSILFKSLLSKGNKEQAIDISEGILERSRSMEERNHEVEAWIRMERALLGVLGGDAVGDELSWCSERLATVSPGSTLHGISLLNLGSWHKNGGQSMMALVIFSDITSSEGFPNDIIGLSRLESGRIHAELGDFESAMRHLWIAMKRLSGGEMSAESIVCAMEWLDIALDNVDPATPRMSEIISEAKPRETRGETRIPSNPDDVREAVEQITPLVTGELSGPLRDDLGIIIDAGELIEEPSWANMLRERISEIQDPRIIEALQS